MLLKMGSFWVRSQTLFFSNTSLVIYLPRMVTHDVIKGGSSTSILLYSSLKSARPFMSLKTSVKVQYVTYESHVHLATCWQASHANRMNVANFQLILDLKSSCKDLDVIFCFTFKLLTV